MASSLSLPESWADDLDHLRTDVVSALAHRTLWRQVSGEWPSPLPETPAGLWALHYTMLYMYSQAIAVRRIARRSRAAISLDSVLRAIECSPAQFAARRVANNRVDPAKDLRRLRQAVAPIANWASENVAHLDRAFGLPDPSIWDKMDNALDVIGELINAHMRALKGEGEVTDFTALCRDPSWQLPGASPLLNMFASSEPT